MRWIWIDKFVEFTSKESATALKNITLAEEYLHDLYPAFPIMPQLLLPGGQLPLPTKYRITFGEPMRFTGDPDDDDAVLDGQVTQVLNTIQSMLQVGLRDREHVFW